MKNVTFVATLLIASGYKHIYIEPSSKEHWDVPIKDARAIIEACGDDPDAELCIKVSADVRGTVSSYTLEP